MDWTARVRTSLAGRGGADEGVVEELAQHAQAMYDSARADGATVEDATRQVDLQVALWADDSQVLKHRTPRVTSLPLPADLPRGSWHSGLLGDVRYACRLFRRQAAFTLLVVTTMAVGIGATTTLFSVTYGVLMKPLPWRDAERLVLLSETRGGRAPRFNSFSNAAYLAWRDGMSTVDDLAAWSTRSATLSGDGEPERIRVTASTASLFTVLGTRPLIGNLYAAADERAGEGRVIVLSEGLWRLRFGADPGVLGQLVQLDGEAHRIVGVLADAQAYPDRTTKAWVPFRVVPAAGNFLSMFNAIARLRPGATPEQAAAEGTARGTHAADTGMTTMAIFGGDGPIEIGARPMRDAVTAPVRLPLLVLLAAVALLLVTAVANIASLQLARATTRRREVAIRAALGAGTTRVTRQLLIENVLLGLAGGAAGLGITVLLHWSLDAVLPADFPRASDIGVGAAVVAFSLGLSVTTSVVLGVVPALRARRVNLVESLAEDVTGAVGHGRWSAVAQARRLIMIGQVAIACILLVAASLVGRSFMAMISADRGYEPEGVMTARLAMPAPLYTPERRFALVTSVLGRLESLSGGGVAFTSEMPLTPGGSTSALTLPRPFNGVTSAQASPRIVSANAFHALGMRVVAGRSFTDADTETSMPVVVVNQAFARRYLGPAAVGANLPMGVGYMDAQSLATVVGVVEDVRYLTAADASQPEMYYAYRQLKGRLPVPVVTLLVRGGGDDATRAAALRVAAREADDRLVADSVMTLSDRVVTTLARPRLYALLLGAFAVFSVAIAALGLFGVLSYAVAQRSRELAVRIALGARRVDIVRLVLGQGLAVSIIGLAAGLAGSLVLTRTIGALLYGIGRFDAVTYAVVPLLVLTIAVAACLVPARRAARIDPLRLLKGA